MKLIVTTGQTILKLFKASIIIIILPFVVVSSMVGDKIGAGGILANMLMALPNAHFVAAKYDIIAKCRDLGGHMAKMCY